MSSALITHRLGESRFATANPRPTPTPAGASPSRWNGSNMPARASSGTPGPLSITRISTRCSIVLAVTRTCESGAYFSAFSTTFATTRSSRPEIGQHVR